MAGTFRLLAESGCGGHHPLPTSPIRADTGKSSGKQFHHGSHAFSDRVGHFILRSISENRLVPQAPGYLLRRIGTRIAIHMIGSDILVTHRPHFAGKKTQLIESFGRIGRRTA